ncbi:MAG: T9SS type A sorting domain-containing protein, partial [Bacteroidota bacterium]
ETAIVTINLVTSVVAKADPAVLNMTERIIGFHRGHNYLFDINSSCSFELIECTLNGRPQPFRNGVFSIYLSCFSIGSNEVVLKVRDATGNIISGKVQVVVNDLAKPVISKKDATINLDENGNASIKLEDVTKSYSDNCGIERITVSPNTFDCSNLGANEVIITAIDRSGNTTTKKAIVTIALNEPTSVTPKVNPLVLDMTGDIKSFTYTHETLFDIESACNVELLACSLNGIPISLENGVFHIDLSCAEVGSNEVILKVKDVAGNMVTGKTQIELNDASKPQITLRDITVSLDENGQANYEWEDVVVEEFDNCGILSRTLSANTVDCAQVGANTVTITAVDVNGNMTSKTATITVIDEILPIARCKDATVTLDESGSTLLTPEMIDGDSYDNCSIDAYTLDWDEFSCEDIGTQTVRLSVFDPSGLSRSCTAEVTVVQGDALPPAFSTTSITPSSGTATASLCDGYFHLQSTQTSSYNYKKGWGEFTYVTIEGDFSFTAELKSKSSNGIAGIMVRKGGHAESIMGFVGQHGFNMDGGVKLDENSRMLRNRRGRSSRTMVLNVTRQGDVVTFTQGRSVLLQLSLDLGTSAQVGLFLSSSNNEEATASFNNVSYSTNNTNASLQMSPYEGVGGGVSTNLEVEDAVSSYESTEHGLTTSEDVKDTASLSSNQEKTVSPLRGLGGGKTLELKTFPNPSTGSINIDIKALIGNTAVLNVYNLSGQPVYKENLGMLHQSLYQIDLSELEAGMYIISIEAAGQLFHQKITIKK